MKLSSYLNIVFPKKRGFKSKEDILQDALEQLLSDRDVRNRDGEYYIFGREMTSRLFTGKINMPLCVVYALKDSKSYAGYLLNEISEANEFEDLYEIAIKLQNELNKDMAFSDEFKERSSESIKERDYASFFWSLFVECCKRDNRENVKSNGKRGRPKIDRPDKSFFNMSAQDARENLPKALRFFESSKYEPNNESIDYLLNMLVYCPVQPKKTDIQAICKRTMDEKFVFSKEGKIDLVYDKFEDMKIEFPQKSERLTDWMNIMAEELAITLIESLKAANEKGKRNCNYSDERHLWEWINNAHNPWDKKEFIHRLIDNSFFLPPFLNSEGQEAWKCCLLAATFSAKEGISSSFEEAVRKVSLEREDPNNKANYLINMTKKLMMLS